MAVLPQLSTIGKRSKKEGVKTSDSITQMVELITAIVSLITGVVSLVIALNGRQKLNDVDTRVQRISSGTNPKCIEGPTHIKGSPGHINLRIRPEDMNGWWFVAVSRNSADSVWVQTIDRPDPEGNLSLEGWGFKGKYTVYGACDDKTITRFQELQARAANNKPANLLDLLKGAVLICKGEAKA